MPSYCRAIVEIEYPIFNIKKGAEEACRKTESFIYEQFYNRMKQRVYSLELLKRLDHPYAKRHYPFGTPIDERLLAARGIYDVPLGIINKQSGKLLASLKREHKATEKEAEVKVWISKDATKYVKFVFFGTKKMIARPLHIAIVAKYGEDIIKIFGKTFVKKFVERKVKKKYVSFR